MGTEHCGDFNCDLPLYTKHERDNGLCDFHNRSAEIALWERRRRIAEIAKGWSGISGWRVA